MIDALSTGIALEILWSSGLYGFEANAWIGRGFDEFYYKF
jgi:hypothetical protein